MNGDLVIRDDVEIDSFEGVLDGRVVGRVIYKRLGDRVVIRHTVVDPEFRGTGVGTRLVQGVLDELLARGQTLTNYCGFVADFLDAHPDYQRVVDADHAGVTLPAGRRGPTAGGPDRR
jgi:uncharacterized protein